MLVVYTVHGMCLVLFLDPQLLYHCPPRRSGIRGHRAGGGAVLEHVVGVGFGHILLWYDENKSWNPYDKFIQWDGLVASGPALPLGRNPTCRCA